ncbi:hypothetical protein MTHERMOG20_20280 [Moorella thermoacetica]|uniref:Uncharacterized protein n=1 Tax=Moorella thermoacetica (strain ATCC 39073 / JCM 9320) TaxID=264732 RepID=Q2RKC6_MOOTA|nr:hypothetical protein [Moorella thermoacetica]AKX96191.1 hypothetical protein MOTHA_c08340 [Moorella thermoacetica]OIQ12500.1 hypothetical protein MOOTH_04990 [Moorella thermoacetica]OIQ55403.1 hypothetical protein MOCA_19750 [Moorella thermoacetica]QDA00002.1 hypothetical protein MothHH_00848 [Moorella thermoacetica]TYL08096.1 hypothetical protein MOOCA_19740 [Moorella thermoacetica]
MAYFFIILGALLILSFVRPALTLLAADRGAPALPPPGDTAAPGGGSTPGNEQVKELEARLADLQEEVASLTARLAGEADSVPGTVTREAAFRAYLDAALASGVAGGAGAAPAGQEAAARRAGAAGPPGNAGTAAKEGPGQVPARSREGAPDIREEIRRAHARGESIESLARRFGRGKGEIALILNLHR